MMILAGASFPKAGPNLGRELDCRHPRCVRVCVHFSRYLVPRCFRWNQFRVRIGKLTPERCLEFGHFPAACCCNR